MVLFSVKLPCGHSADVPCYKSATPDQKYCKAKCGATLLCGHRCSGTCSACYQVKICGFLNKFKTRIYIYLATAANRQATICNQPVISFLLRQPKLAVSSYRDGMQ